MIGMPHPELGEEVGAAVAPSPAPAPRRTNCARSPGTGLRRTVPAKIWPVDALPRARPGRSCAARCTRPRTKGDQRRWRVVGCQAGRRHRPSSVALGRGTGGVWRAPRARCRGWSRRAGPASSSSCSVAGRQGACGGDAAPKPRRHNGMFGAARGEDWSSPYRGWQWKDLVLVSNPPLSRPHPVPGAHSGGAQGAARRRRPDLGWTTPGPRCAPTPSPPPGCAQHTLSLFLQQQQGWQGGYRVCGVHGPPWETARCWCLMGCDGGWGL